MNLLQIEKIDDMLRSSRSAVFFIFMDNIYKECLQAVRNGSKYQVNFKTRTLRIDKTSVIDNGRWEGGLGIAETDPDTALSHLETLYSQYKNSVPSERSETSGRRHFKALREHELSADALLYGMPREEAGYMLEATLLLFFLNGTLVWGKGPLQGWFWRSSKDSDFVILKNIF